MIRDATDALVREGMELLRWNYSPEEWADQLRRREAYLEKPRGILGHLARLVRDALPQDTRRDSLPVGPGWREFFALRDCNWTDVLMTTTGLILESHTYRPRPESEAVLLRPDLLLGVYPWRGEPRVLTRVELVSAGWDALRLRFGASTLGATAPPMPIPVPGRLKADVEEIAELLWHKTNWPGRPPKWLAS